LVTAPLQLVTCLSREACASYFRLAVVAPPALSQESAGLPRFEFMTELHVLRVFVDGDGGAGNPLGVFLDGAAVPADQRQRVAARLNYSETVFVDDVVDGLVEIYTPTVSLPFAGHPTVGTAWLLTQRAGAPPAALRPPAGEVAVFEEGDMSWIRARGEWAPPMRSIQLESAAAVEALAGPQSSDPDVYVWAWRDEPAGAVASRFFAPGFGIPEDPATGAAAVMLCAQLGRELRIQQQGSELFVRPAAREGWVELGGSVVLDGQRDFAL
jgi:predicted PhzF superfamily epimerase YddE/YHI9